MSIAVMKSVNYVKNNYVIISSDEEDVDDEEIHGTVTQNDSLVSKDICITRISNGSADNVRNGKKLSLETIVSSLKDKQSDSTCNVQQHQSKSVIVCSQQNERKLNTTTLPITSLKLDPSKIEQLKKNLPKCIENTEKKKLMLETCTKSIENTKNAVSKHSKPPSNKRLLFDANKIHRLKERLPEALSKKGLSSSSYNHTINQTSTSQNLTCLSHATPSSPSQSSADLNTSDFSEATVDHTTTVIIIDEDDTPSTTVDKQNQLVESASQSSDQPCTSKFKKSNKKIMIRHLEKKLARTEKEMERLEAAENSYADMGREESAYLTLDRLKERFMKMWRKYCNLNGDDPDQYLATRKAIRVRSSAHPHLNRAVADFVNQQSEDFFPDIFTIKKVCSDANEKYNLKLKSSTLESAATLIFSEVGNKLQKNRRKDFNKHFGNRLTDQVDLKDDPAHHNEHLKNQLKANRKLAKYNTDAVFIEYAKRQEQGGNSESESEEISSQLLSASSRRDCSKKRRLDVVESSDGSSDEKCLQSTKRMTASSANKNLILSPKLKKQWKHMRSAYVKIKPFSPSLLPSKSNLSITKGSGTVSGLPLSDSESFPSHSKSPIVMKDIINSTTINNFELDKEKSNALHNENNIVKEEISTTESTNAAQALFSVDVEVNDKVEDSYLTCSTIVTNMTPIKQSQSHVPIPNAQQKFSAVKESTDSSKVNIDQSGHYEKVLILGEKQAKSEHESATYISPLSIFRKRQFTDTVNFSSFQKLSQRDAGFLDGTKRISKSICSPTKNTLNGQRNNSKGCPVHSEPDKKVDIITIDSDDE